MYLFNTISFSIMAEKMKMNNYIKNKSLLSFLSPLKIIQFFGY